MNPLILKSYTLANALGAGVDATLAALLEHRSGLRPCDYEDARLDTAIGRAEGLESLPVTGALAPFDCRNNRLAQLALRQDGFEEAVAAARNTYGAHRIAVLIGTSTSGIRETELAYQRRNPDSGQLPGDFRYRHTHNIFSSADFVRSHLQLNGIATAISTACSSSAKVFASASRLIEAGLCDAAVVGGVDSLCLTTLYGFASLELLSPAPCRPFDAARNGISIGEAAGFALLEKRGRADEGSREKQVALLGYGESSDAHHMSQPHPEGQGAARAMRQALNMAGLDSTDIDYINLHGTATKSNDSAEDKAVTQVFGPGKPCSSTKGWTGHTLGAAGITEAIISALCIEQGFLPANLNTSTVDPGMTSQIIRELRRQPVTHVLTNSFGFGGNNCSLILGRTP